MLLIYARCVSWRIFRYLHPFPIRQDAWLMGSERSRRRRRACIAAASATALALGARASAQNGDKYMHVLVGGAWEKNKTKAEETSRTSNRRTRKASSSRCVGRSDVFPGNRTCIFTNILLHFKSANGNGKNKIDGGEHSEWTFSAIGGKAANVTTEPLYNHNRWALGSAFRLEMEEDEKQNETAASSTTKYVIDDRCLVLVEEHHVNPGHLLWDSMFSSWAALLAVQPHVALDADQKFQWITVKPTHRSSNNGDGGGGRWELLHTFSGFPVLSVEELAKSVVEEGKEGDIDIVIDCLIAGVAGRGIAVVGPKGAVELGSGPPSSYYAEEIQNPLDPVLGFRDRLYQAHGLSSPKLIAPQTSGAPTEPMPVCGMRLTVVESKRTLSGVVEAAGPIAEKHGMNLTVIRWEDISFRQQMEICASTAVLVVGVGTVRANSFLLPEGSTEVQTCQPLSVSEAQVDHFHYNFSGGLKRTCFDSHIGTLLSHVRVLYPQDYSEEERQRQSVPASFQQTLEEAASSVPYAPIPLDRRWTQQPPEIASTFPSLIEEVPELLHVQSGWCVPTQKNIMGQMPSDCTPGRSCPVISNNMHYFLTLDDKPAANGCISNDRLQQARRKMERLWDAGIDLHAGDKVENTEADNNVRQARDHAVYGNMKEGISGKLKYR